MADATTVPVATTGQVQTGPGSFVDAASISPQGAAMAANYQATKDQTSASPTVLTDANIREKVIPEIQSQATAFLGPAGSSAAKTDPAGSSSDTSSSSDFYDNLYKNFAAKIDDPNSQDSQGELDLLKSMKTQGDAQTEAALANIHSKYAELSGALTQSQNASTDSLKNSLLLSGNSRYAPASANGTLDAKHTADVEALRKLQDQENSAVLTAEQARSNRDFQLLDKQLGIVKDTRQAKLDLAKNISENMAKQGETLTKQNLQSTRDSAVASLVADGTTDPNELLTKLNGGDTTQTGGYTLDEINKALKALAPADDPSKLTGAVKNFYILKGQGQLPASVSSLPENDQLFGYLHQQKLASSISTGAKTPSTRKITYSEAKSLGLPISVAGSSEADILDSLKSEEAPAWFKEKLSTEGGDPKASSTPALWNTYRAKVNAGTAAPKKGTTTTSTSLY